MKLKTKIKNFFFVFWGTSIVLYLFLWLNFFGEVKAGSVWVDWWGWDWGFWWEWFMELIVALVDALYVLLRPLLTIAWASLSNDFVYGSVFNMDWTIWFFWNVMKNFANYIIWFVFLIWIFFYLFNYKQDSYNPKSMLPKLMIATVWVQVSWFVVAVLIDLSTILTYAVWWLPISAFDSEDASSGYMEEVLIMPVMSLNMDEWAMSWTWDSRSLFYTSPWTEKAIIPCPTTWWKIGWDEIDYESASESLDNVSENRTSQDLLEDVCVVWWNVVWRIDSENWQCNLEEKVNEAKNNSEFEWWISLNDYISDMSWFTWTMYTLFWSLLNISDMAFSSVGWEWASAGSQWMMSIIKIVLFFALIIPLITLAIVLILRAVLLWMIITLSPLLTIFWTFGWSWDKMTEKFSISNVLALIFLPVVVVFALSVWIMFMVVLMALNPMGWDWSSWSWVSSAMWIEMSEWMCEEWGQEDDDEDDWWHQVCYDIPVWGDNHTKLCFNTPWQAFWFDAFNDMFSWLLINLFGIAILWWVVFAALKTSKLTSWVVEWVDKMSKEFAKTAPVIPTPGGGMQSVWSLEVWMERFKRQPQIIQDDQFSKWELSKVWDKFQDFMTPAPLQNVRSSAEFHRAAVDDVGSDPSWWTSRAIQKMNELWTGSLQDIERISDVVRSEWNIAQYKEDFDGDVHELIESGGSDLISQVRDEISPDEQYSDWEWNYFMKKGNLLYHINPETWRFRYYEKDDDSELRQFFQTAIEWKTNESEARDLIENIKNELSLGISDVELNYDDGSFVIESISR